MDIQHTPWPQVGKGLPKTRELYRLTYRPRRGLWAGGPAWPGWARQVWAWL